MTFSTLITYESGFELLIHEGCDHITCLTSTDFKASEGLYNEVFEAAGAATDEMLERMWSTYNTDVARKCSEAELERVRTPYYVLEAICWSFFLNVTCVGEDSVQEVSW